MIDNPITEDIREVRHQLAAEFDDDVYKIAEETRRRQAASGRRVIRLPRRVPRISNAPKSAVDNSGDSGVN